MSAATNPVSQAVVWLNDPLNWTNPGGILDRLGEHVSMSAAAVLLGCLVAWPLGLWLGHIGRGGGLVVLVSNLTLAVPTLALLTILPLTFLGFGRPAVVLALAVFAVPPLLANAYTGVRQVDPQTREAARGMGMTGVQVLRRVELPLAVPYLAAGFRTAAVQVVATAALATFVNGGGLGEIIRFGFGLSIAVGGGQILAGGLLVAGLAVSVELLFALVERLVTPRPLRRARRRAGRRAADAVAGS
ncbi:ABC transporter permease [Verrucosispora sp. CWR15]|uniref:ABC transporter permease n=1 Tax=Verrucosispora sioxanthis TaxID=2499994 RepID=A0A6M1L957_9ACTN|nr:ABC transporter permease [Verrucosispora sioxanthis]NEE65639.1 ABC transporter permease [Verrucosispora sioxanthis]NGM14749.1 ABC transporter permease [Verrucosispora sioxanthis]